MPVKLNKAGELPVYARVTVDGKRAEISLQRSTPAALWDQAAQRRQRGTSKNPKHLPGPYSRQHSENIQSTAFNREVHYYPADQKAVHGEDRDHKTLVEVIDYHLLQMLELVDAKEYSKRTYENYYDTEKLKDYMKKRLKISDIPLPELSMSFITGFKHFLVMKRTLSQNTIHKTIKRIKSILNMAVRMEWLPRKSSTSITFPNRFIYPS